MPLNSFNRNLADPKYKGRMLSVRANTAYNATSIRCDDVLIIGVEDNEAFLKGLKAT